MSSKNPTIDLEIMRLLESEPNLKASEVAKKLKYDNSYTNTNLKLLATEGFLTRNKVDNYYLYSINWDY